MFEHLTLAQRSELWFALPLVGALPLVLSLFGMRPEARKEPSTMARSIG